MTSDERREVAARLWDRWLCRTCVWGFPESVGYSCSRLEGHICSRVVVACEEYRRRCTCETVWLEPPAYCDVCGARVVSDDD